MSKVQLHDNKAFHQHLCSQEEESCIQGEYETQNTLQVDNFCKGKIENK